MAGGGPYMKPWYCRRGWINCRILFLGLSAFTVLVIFLAKKYHLDTVDNWPTGTKRSHLDMEDSWPTKHNRLDMHTDDRSASSYSMDPDAMVKFTKWIIPLPTLDPKSVVDAWFPGWHILVHHGKAPKFCSECVEYPKNGRKKVDFKMAEDAGLEQISLFMPPVLFAIKQNARRIILSKDMAQLRKSIHKLLVDTKPDGAMGLEYIGSNLTLDSYHFHYRSSFETEPLCKYRVRRRLNPVFTTGVRCRGVEDNSVAQMVLLDEQAPPVFASGPKFDLLAPQESVFHYDGFWAMFAAFFSAIGRPRVWGLWVQRLMQEIGADVGLVVLSCPVNAPLEVSPARPNADIQPVFSTITSWSCPKNLDILECSLSLAQRLALDGHISSYSVAALTTWLSELRSIGYKPPSRQFLSKSEQYYDNDALKGCVIHNPALVVQGGLAKLPQYQFPHKLFPTIEEHCGKLPRKSNFTEPFQAYKLDPSDRSKLRDIALVVIFYNSTIFNNIIQLEEIHRNYFNQIIYCGPYAEIFAQHYVQQKRPVSYLEVPFTHGNNAFDCLTRAMMMNYGVNGYMEVADDVLLNTWTLKSLPRDRFWFQREHRVAHLHQQYMPDFFYTATQWKPWYLDNQRWGKKAMAKVWAQLKELQSEGTNKNTESLQMVQSFLSTLAENSGRAELFIYSTADIFYVPAVYRRRWIFLGNIFVTNEVYLEIAVPTLMNGIDLNSNILRLDGDYLWYTDRVKYREHYRPSSNFLHPWKLKNLENSEDAAFFCFNMLPRIVDDLV